MKIDKNNTKSKLWDFIKNLFRTIISEKRLRNLWLFGSILVAFSIFIDFKLILVILFMMFFLTMGSLNQIKKEGKDELEQLLEEKKEIELILKTMEEHIESGQATLDEKIEYKQLQEELNNIHILLTKKETDNKRA